MIRLGDSSFWLDPTATGWMLVHAVPAKGKAAARVERFGPFTSPRHALQQRQVDLPRDVRRELRALAAAMDPDAGMEDLPPAP